MQSTSKKATCCTLPNTWDGRQKHWLPGVKPVRPERIWDALDVLAKALEKAGHPKPSRARGRPSKSETPTPEDLVASPYDDPMLAAEQEEMYERMAALPDFIPKPSKKAG